MSTSNPGGGSLSRPTLPYPNSPTLTQHHGLPLSLAEVEEEGQDMDEGRSIISSRMTDLDASENGEIEIGSTGLQSPGARSRPSSYQLSPDARNNRMGSGQNFFQMDTFSRPSTAASSQAAKNWLNQPPPSRRAFTPSIRARPTSSASRTHAPSLTSHAFYRPMSSAKLQAQRGGRVKDDSDNDGNRTRFGSGAFSLEFGQSDESTRQSSGEQNGHLRTETFSTEDSLQFGQFRAMNSISPTRQTLQESTTSVTPLHTSDEEPPKTPQNGQNQNGTNKNPRLPPGSSSSSGGPSKPLSDSIKKRVFVERNFDRFPGNTNFCCWGRFQTANDLPMNVLTAILVMTPCALFFAFSAKWLWFYISPALPITFAYLFLACLSSFVKAAVSDPGIYPRNIHPLEADDEDDPLAVLPTNGWARMPALSKNELPLEVPIKYCPTCRIWRPPRCHHCRVCDNCIETHDHHCVWLNNCVGRRNYRYFFTFVSTATALAFYLLALSTLHIVYWKNDHGISFQGAIKALPVPFAMMIYGGIAILYPLALMCYHLFLMARGQTTREYLLRNKSRPPDKHRPFDQGSWWKNYVVVLCRPRPPTYVQFKARYQEGDQRFEIRRRIPVTVSPASGHSSSGNDSITQAVNEAVNGPTENRLRSESGAGGDETRIETLERRIITSE